MSILRTVFDNGPLFVFQDYSNADLPIVIIALKKLQRRIQQ